MKKQAQAKYQQGIAQHIFTSFVLKHIAGNQPQIIGIKDKEIAQGNTAMAKKRNPIESPFAVDKNNGETKNEQPTYNMNAHFQKTSLYKQMFHMGKYR